MRRCCSEKAAAESRVNEQDGVLGRATAEINHVESMMRDELQLVMTECEHADSEVQLPGEVVIIKEQKNLLPL